MTIVNRKAAILLFIASIGCALAADEKSPPSVDCTATNTSCPEIAVAGADIARLADGTPSIFHGMADPVMRAELGSKTIWYAYSSPSAGVYPAAPGSAKLGFTVDIKYARSDDGGQTWRDMGTLWPSTPESDPASGVAGRSVSEVANFVPYRMGGKSGWYGTHLSYLIPEVGGARAMSVSSFRIYLMRAATVPELARAPSAIIGGAGTSAGWGVAYDFSKLSDEASHCAGWSEPALYVANRQLYIALRCYWVEPGAPRDTPIMIFSAPLQEDILKLHWQYRGILASRKEALELEIPGAVAFTEVELATGRDGQLLAILQPDHGNDPVTHEDIHYGCRVFEVASLDHPSLKRDANGKLIIRAVATASDNVDGPSSCGYDAASATGLVISRKDRHPPAQEMTVNLTGLKP